MKELLFWIIGIVFSVTLIYGSYWVAKPFSYTIFYEDMVEQTIHDMVKPEYLKDK